jgi:hypothetical protein
MENGFKRVGNCVAMKRAELIVTSKPEDDFLTGVCSSCPQVHFRLTGNTLEQKRLLRTMFDNHFRRVHMREEPATPRP